MSRETVSKITDQVPEEMTAWMNRARRGPARIGQDCQTQRQRTPWHVVSTIRIPGRYEVAADLVSDFTFKHSQLQAGGEVRVLQQRKAVAGAIRKEAHKLSTSPLSNMAMTSG